MPFTFHTIRDIRKCWLRSPDNSFWIVDYMANEKSILPLSVRYDDLSDDDKLEVLAAYLEVLNDENPSPITTLDMCETLDKFFSDYWEIIPEVSL